MPSETSTISMSLLAPGAARILFSMRNFLMFTAMLLVALPASAVESDVVLVHVRAYPSPGAAPLEDATLITHAGHIVSVSSAVKGKPVKIPRGASIIDCTGLSVTAGFWNSHVHLLPVEFLHADQKTGAQLTSAFQEMLTGWGFTTVFDVASLLGNVNQIRSRIASGEVDGPRILSVGEPFFPQNGVPIYVQKYLEDNRIELPDDLSTQAAVERVDRQVADGADGIKIFAGSIEAHDILLMPLDRAKVIVAEAHRLHRPVFAHPSNLAGLEIALDSGVDVLAHVTSYEEPWTPAILGRMLAARMALTPTLTLFDVEIEKEGAPPEIVKKFVDRAVARLRQYSEAGGEILFGTDVGYIYQFDTAEEYRLMQQAGMTFPQILASLTTNPARRFGFSAHSGRIAPGMDADLSVLAGDPAADIEALSRVRYTIRAGKVIFSAPGQPVPPAR